MVAQVNRFAILLLPLIFILLPLPGAYAWQMRRRVFRHYHAIRAIDMEARETASPERLRELETQLDKIDAEVAQMTLPPPYRDRAYTAQLHIELVRQRVESRLLRLADAARN